MSRGARPLPARTLPEVVAAFPTVRQSLLGEVDNCPRSALFGLESTPFTNAAQARGILFHRVAAEILRTLRRTGETRMAPGDGLEILYELAAQRDVEPRDLVHVPARERRLLRMAVIKLCAENEFNMERLVDVERRLFAIVAYPSREWRDCPLCRDPRGLPLGRDAKTGEACGECGGARLLAGEGQVSRELTGQPDALLADPPDGAIVLDWKTSLQPPPRLPEGEDHWDDAAHVSYGGYFQQRKYALLVMRNFPAVQRVTLREFYPLQGEVRKAMLLRSDLPGVEREMATLAEAFDRAAMGGSQARALWPAQPGKHCSYCPRPSACPIEHEARAEGAITSQAAAERYAADFVVADRVRKHRLAAAKAWVDAHGPIRVKSAKGRYVLDWRGERGRRRFGVHVVDESDRGPADPLLDAALAEAAGGVSGVEVSILALPIVGTLGCSVPVVPGTPDVDAPMERRTELCAVDAHWVVGSAPCCDVHARVMCEVAGWDWPEFWREAGRTAESVAVPWADRQRHSQEAARGHAARFAGGGADAA